MYDHYLALAKNDYSKGLYNLKILLVSQNYTNTTKILRPKLVTSLLKVIYVDFYFK